MHFTRYNYSDISFELKDCGVYDTANILRIRKLLDKNNDALFHLQRSLERCELTNLQGSQTEQVKPKMDLSICISGACKNCENNVAQPFRDHSIHVNASHFEKQLMQWDAMTQLEKKAYNSDGRSIYNYAMAILNCDADRDIETVNVDLAVQYGKLAIEDSLAATPKVSQGRFEFTFTCSSNGSASDDHDFDDSDRNDGDNSGDVDYNDCDHGYGKVCDCDCGEYFDDESYSDGVRDAVNKDYDTAYEDHDAAYEDLHAAQKDFRAAHENSFADEY